MRQTAGSHPLDSWVDQSERFGIDTLRHARNARPGIPSRAFGVFTAGGIRVFAVFQGTPAEAAGWPHPGTDRERVRGKRRTPPSQSDPQRMGGVSRFRFSLRRRVPPLAAGQSRQRWRGTMPHMGASCCQSQPVRSVQMLRPANDNWFLSRQPDPHRGPRKVVSIRVARGCLQCFHHRHTLQTSTVS